MLSGELRVLLIVLAFFFLIVVVSNVNKKNLQLKYSLIWIFASVILVVIAIAPKIAFKVAKIIGIETPSNFIFFVALIWLIGMNFSLTIIVSRQANKIKRIVQEVSLEKEKLDESVDDIEKERIRKNETSYEK